MTELIPVGDARIYVMDTADDMIVVEFPIAVQASRSTIREIERRLEEFLKREVLPLLKEDGMEFDPNTINNTKVSNPIWTYILFQDRRRS